jgi:kynurenine formamidase
LNSVSLTSKDLLKEIFMTKKPTEQEVLAYFDQVNNWGRWGKDDEIGTINFITAEKIAQAARLVTEGQTVSCARPIIAEPAPDVRIPPIHFMLSAGDTVPESGSGGTMDFIGVAFHGSTVTHLDASCHAFWNGKMYNDRPASLVSARDFAQAGSIELLEDGVVSRGVLLDIARLKGKEWMEPGEGVFPEDLEAAEEQAGVKVGEGDILLIRTGNYKRRLTLGPKNDGGPGPHAALLPWLHERRVAILGSDTPNDTFPREYPAIGLPLHHIGIVAMGLWLLDNANLETLSEQCTRLNRWEFMLSAGPLRVQNGTGSPVNPLAIF